MISDGFGTCDPQFPTPGSEKAIRFGCNCQAGQPGAQVGEFLVYWFGPDCPLHDQMVFERRVTISEVSR